MHDPQLNTVQNNVYLTAHLCTADRTISELLKFVRRSVVCDNFFPHGLNSTTDEFCNEDYKFRSRFRPLWIYNWFAGQRQGCQPTFPSGPKLSVSDMLGLLAAGTFAAN